MTFRAIILTLAAFFYAAVSPATAGPEQRGDPQSIAAATHYLEAYQALDLDRLKHLYAEDAAFDDPTSLFVRGIGGPFVWRGRTQILDGIRSWIDGGVASLRYEIEDVYESSGRVVFIGSVNPLMRAPNGMAQYRYRIVTIVTVENGLVTEHRDYTDYAGVAEVTAEP